MPIGSITRGTTGTNRLRRVDRYLTTLNILRTSTDPLVIDLGFGASGVTAFELYARLAHHRPSVEVIGLEIDPERVRAARAQLALVRTGDTPFSPASAVSFDLGGFDVALPRHRRPAVIRAFNVLRQYNEDQVPDAWALMTDRLQPGGAVIEGTCDEIGRIVSWVTLDGSGPVSFTLSLRVADIDTPSIVAERLPKALIHHNVEGEPIHSFLSDLDRSWRNHSALRVYGATQRWIATVRSIAESWPVTGRPSRWRLGEVTVPWSAVAPRA